MFALFFLLFTAAAQAMVISPTSREVHFSYDAEFETQSKDSADALVVNHGRYLFGYFQNGAIVKKFKQDPRFFGIGAPRWVPHFEVQEDREEAGKRHIRYHVNGSMLLLNKVADRLVKEKAYGITMPFDLDHFFDLKCTDPDYPSPGDFWYFYNPFKRECAKLGVPPLAHPVMISLSEAPAAKLDTQVGLANLRGDNENGSLFQITSINGFSADSRDPQDDGRQNYEKMNAWFRQLGFTETVLEKGDREIHQFDRRVLRANGTPLDFRITRLLSETDLGMGGPRYAQFLANAIQESDVLLYEGHSGMGANLSLSEVEKVAGAPIAFHPAKRQIFYFDSCSSYSYFLGMFQGKKDPGTLGVISNGLESIFSAELPITKQFYRALLSGSKNDGLRWMDFLRDIEAPLKGQSFMLNVDINFESTAERAQWAMILE